MNINFKKCPYCQENIPEESNFCPVCFRMLMTPRKLRPHRKLSANIKALLFTTLFLILMVVLGLILGFCGEKKESPVIPNPTATGEVTDILPTILPEILPTEAPIVLPSTSPKPEIPQKDSSVILPTLPPSSSPLLPVSTPTMTPEASPKPTPTVPATSKPTASPTPTIKPETLYEYSGNTITKYKGQESHVVVPTTLGGEKITTIKSAAFQSNQYIESVTIPSGITTIEGYTFHNCLNLDTVTIADSVTVLEAGCFSDCINLKNIKLSAGLTKISENLFYNCLNLEEINLPDSIEGFSANAFENSGLKKLFIPAKVRYMGYGCFKSTKNLREFTVHSDNERYYSKDGVLFETFGNLETLSCYPAGRTDASYTIPDEINKLELYAFYGNPYLKTVYLSKNIWDIPFGAFSYCTSLTKVHTNEKLSSLRGQAFKGCTNLESIYLCNNVTIIGDDSFDDCPKLTIELNEGSYAYKFTVKNGINYIFNQ